MKNKILALIFGAATVSMSALANEVSYQTRDGFRWFQDQSRSDPAAGVIIGTYAITFFPTVLAVTAVGVTMAEKTEKADFVRAAALEAAEYLNGKATGPYLQLMFDVNPDNSADELVGIVLDEAAKL